MTRLHGADYLDALRLGRGMLTWDVTPGSGAAGLIGIARDYLTGFAAAALVATYQPWIAVGALATALVMRVRWARRDLPDHRGLDGNLTRPLDDAAWRESLSGAFQDFVRFQVFARESVGVGRVVDVTERVRVQRALALTSPTSWGVMHEGPLV